MNNKSKAFLRFRAKNDHICARGWRSKLSKVQASLVSNQLISANRCFAGT